MPYSLVTSGANSSIDAVNVSVTGLNTTGATLILAAVFDETGGSSTFSDNKSNTWTALTAKQDAGSGKRVQLYYCINPTVGSGHNFTAVGGSGTFPALAVDAFSHTSTPAFDKQGGATQASGASLSPGSLSPASNDELFYAAVNTQGGASTVTWGSSFVETADVPEGGSGDAAHAAYKIQTTAGAENPTATASLGDANAMVMALFTAAGGGFTVYDQTRWQMRGHLRGVRL